MRPLRILHVTPYWAEAWAYGGIPRVVGALTHHLAGAGHAVTVCATDVCSATERLQATAGGRRATGHGLRAPWPPQRTDDGVELRVFPNRSNRLAHDWQCYTPVGLNRYLRDHACDFDVAHLHACRNLPGAIAAHHLTRHGVPYVLAPNGTAPVIERRFAAKRFFDALAGSRMLREAAAVLAVSDVERRQLRDLGVPDARIHLVPNPLHLAEFDRPVERGRFRQRLGLTSERLVVFLGKITPRKRVDVLTRAFASLGGDCQQTHLVIAGNDMGGMETARDIARQMGVASRVHFPGLLMGHDRLEALADADVVVYPSQDEIFGLVPLEALLAGTPVIVAGDSGCGEIVTGTGGGIVVPAADVPALASAIARVLSDPATWRCAALAAAAQVRLRYGGEAVTAQLEQVYAHVATPGWIGATHAGSGISVVVPVKNGMPTIAGTIASIEAQRADCPMEILVVDDRSTDEGPAWLKACADAGRIRLLDGGGRGASAAINVGVRAARYPLICQIDQDVELRKGWLTHAVGMLESDNRIAAVQGHYTTTRDAPVTARVMALDLEQRYVALDDNRGETGHVCTGNALYRAAALRGVGLFDETLGYGYDNDMSYRLRAAGWRLAHARHARSLHHWREGLIGYCRQQYGFGYGRLDLVARHPDRISGDSVSPAAMMAHPLVMLVAILCLAIGGGLTLAGLDGRAVLLVGAGLVALLSAERAVAGLRAWWRFSDPAALLFPFMHLLRDLAWDLAIVVWVARRIHGRASRPSDSMRERSPAATSCQEDRVSLARQPGAFIPRLERVIAIIPAHNEAATLARVVADVRAECPHMDVLIVDDGSTDGTADVLARLGVQWLRMPERMGVGRAMRAGLKYARRLGYDSAVRLDGDGQHRAEDLERLLTPLRSGRADVVMGTRLPSSTTDRSATARVTQRLLGWCLSALTLRRVTDPTSGFCALGPRAARLLADHHPTGYPEPELCLFLSRNALTVVEVPVPSRPRMGGRTSLTAGRIAAAAARVALAMLIVPLRRGVRVDDRD